MALNNRFVFYGEWLDNIINLPLDTQDKIIAEIVRYGTGNQPQYTEDMMITMAVNFTKGAIDHSKEEYQKKVEAGNNYGRKKKVSDEQIYELAKNGMTAQEIAEKLKVGVSTVNHSQGWKNRHNKEFVF